MSNKLKNTIKRINHSVVVCGSLGALAMTGLPTFAQENSVADEEVVVVGIRGALQNALDSKRSSNAVIDSISANDIGKFPDQNIAESLSRVPGVAVSTTFGEGSSVSIRGSSASHTLTTLNGQAVASTGWFVLSPIDRSFDYSMLPSELVAGLDVYKSAQADIIEGGVGGTVVVKTRKPLDLDANTTFASLKAMYSEVSGETDPQISGLYSWKNEAENFGVLAAFAKQDRTYSRKGNESHPGWGNRVAPTSMDQDRERTAADITLQFAPFEGLDISAHILKLEMVTDNTNQGIWLSGENGDTTGNCTYDSRGLVTACNFNQDNIPGGAIFHDARPRFGTMTSDTYDLELNYENDSYTIHAQVGKTEAEGGTELETQYFGAINNAEYVGGYTVGGDRVSINFDGYNSSAMPNVNGGGTVTSTPRTDEESYGQIDLGLKLDFGALTLLKTGIRVTDHSASRIRRTATGNWTEQPVENYLGGMIDVGYGISVPNIDGEKFEKYIRAGITGWDLDRPSYGTIDEENFAAYVMAEFESEYIRGNFGFRYIATDASTEFYGSDINGVLDDHLSSEKYSYDDVLPSVNIAMDLSDDIILRASAAKVMTRPNYQDMFVAPAFVGENDANPTNQVVNIGNIRLDPFQANQADVALEWYYQDASMVSFAYFQKEITNHNTIQVLRDQAMGRDSGEDLALMPSGCETTDCWDVNQQTNGSGGNIRGIELQLQHDFGNGFGGILNYTNQNGIAEETNYSDRVGSFSDASENYLNLVGYYENDQYSTRLAYNWRDGYMVRDGANFYGNREAQAFGSLDASVVYHLTDNIDISAEFVNLLGEEVVHKGNDNPNKVTPGNSPSTRGFPSWTYQAEKRMTVGVSLKF